MLEVRRGRDRGYTDHGWLKTYYTFSFADYYDPEHVDFGPLQVLNEDRVKPGKGYGTQARRDVEILTYIIEGELEHKDSLGNGYVIRAGDLQRMSAGTGVTHSEFNPSSSQDVHLLQICMKPSKAGILPGYEQRHFAPAEKRGALRLIASSSGEAGSVVVHQDARVYVGLFNDSQRAQVELGRNRRAYVHVARGSIAVNETRLNAGDGVKITQPADIVLQHGLDADVIVFDVPAGVPPPKRKVPAAKKRPPVSAERPASSAGSDRPARRRTATSGK
jgi:redox-sensitive bicupin YhaK (pirin superfamily)